MSDAVLKELAQLKSYEPLRNVLIDSELTDNQTKHLAKLLYVKKALLSLGTGLGKTYVASALMKLVLRARPGKKFIFFGKLLQKDETVNKIAKLTGLKVLFLDAKEQTFKDFLNSTEDFDVLFMTVNTLNDMNLMEFIYEYREFIAGVIMDEMHTYCNYQESTNAQMLECMTSYFEFVVGLTATPINSSTDQLASILRIIDRDTYPNKRKSMEAIRNMNYLQQCKIIIEQRSQNLNQGIPIFIEPMEHQRGLMKGSDILKVKGEGATTQIRKIMSCCLYNKEQGNQGLIYIRRIELRPVIHEALQGIGLRVATIYRDDGILADGTRTTSAHICNMFRNKELDVVITCKTEALDLECAYVAFYELTMDVVQFVGRACRGVESKPVKVYFFITLDTFEVKFFIKNVYMRAEEITQILGTNRQETLVVGDILIEKIGANRIKTLLASA